MAAVVPLVSCPLTLGCLGWLQSIAHCYFILVMAQSHSFTRFSGSASLSLFLSSGRVPQHRVDHPLTFSIRTVLLSVAEFARKSSPFSFFCRVGVGCSSSPIPSVLYSVLCIAASLYIAVSLPPITSLHLLGEGISTYTVCSIHHTAAWEETLQLHNHTEVPLNTDREDRRKASSGEHNPLLQPLCHFSLLQGDGWGKWVQSQQSTLLHRPRNSTILHWLIYFLCKQWLI